MGSFFWGGEALVFTIKTLKFLNFFFLLLIKIPILPKEKFILV